MSYTVIRKKQPGGEIISQDNYDDLDRAISEANLPVAVPFTIEATVFDDDGDRKHIVVVGGPSN